MRGSVVIFLLFTAAEIFSGGIIDTRDPLEKVSGEIPLENFKHLVIKGEIEVFLIQGERASLRWETNRALKSQLQVSQWFDTQTISLETGLLGPRERGSLFIQLTLPPSLISLELQSGVKGKTDFLQFVPGIRVKVKDESKLLLLVDTPSLGLEVSWNSSVEIQGLAALVDLELSGGSKVTAQAVDIEGFTLDLSDSELEVWGAPVLKGSLKKNSLLRVQEADTSSVKIGYKSEILIISHNLQPLTSQPSEQSRP